MDSFDRVGLLAELTGEHCNLNHGPQTVPADYPACNYLVLPIGYQEDSIREVSVRELVIPVCGECSQALQEDEWTLLYCFECGSNRWVCRRLAKNSYRHHVLWLRGCPDCANIFRGLFFTDFAGNRAGVPHAVHELHLVT